MTGATPRALSDREIEVLSALGEHLTNAEIASRLHISVRTVESHVSSLMRKLAASGRRELATRAASLVPPAGGDAQGIVGLPTARTSFVGRDAEVHGVLDALASAPLVTLVGPGGVGKTRLAVVVANHAAASFPFGGAFVDLVPASSGYVVHAVAAALDVIERPDRTLEGGVHERLREGRRLLVLDNCEHVLAAAAGFAARALATCPELVLLATSRERLAVAGERVVQVLPLSLGAPAGGGRSDAERLFEERVTATDPAFHAEPADIRWICRRVDGMPLAIELAAARATSIGTDGLVRGLDDHLRLLSTAGGPSDRHRSLRTVIDWSHSLLGDEEQAVFRRLGAFQGGFDLASVAAVATDGDVSSAAHLVGRLAEQSLLVRHQHAVGSRWTMLEALRSYARERLDRSPDGPVIARRYVAWATSAAAELEALLDVDDGWAERFDFIGDDLRAALAVPQDGPVPSEAHYLACALGHLTYARGFLAEAQGHYEQGATSAPDGTAASKALLSAAQVARANMRADLAFDLLQRAAERGSGGARAVALADAVALAERFPSQFAEVIAHPRLVSMLEQATGLAPRDDAVAKAHLSIAAAWNAAAGPSTARGPLARAALEAARLIDDPVLISDALDAVGAAASEQGHHKQAARLAAERLDLLERLSRHLPAVGGEVVDILHMASDSALIAGELQVAVDNALIVRDELRDHIPHMASSHLVTPLVLQGRFAEAQEEADVMIDEWHRAGSPPAAWMSLAVRATSLAFALQELDDRAEEWRALAHRIGREIEGFPLFADLRVALHRGDLAASTTLLEVVPDASSAAYDMFTRAVAAEVAVVVGSDRASRLVEEALETKGENDWAAACSQRAAGRLSGDASMIEVSLDGWDRIDARFEWACTLTLLPERATQGVEALAALGCKPPAV